MEAIWAAVAVTAVALTVGVPERVSLTGAGGEADAESTAAAVSDDGRFVAFESYAGNLVPGDGNDWLDVFLRDRLLGTTVRVSTAWDGTDAADGAHGPAISGDGRFVAFESYSDDLVPNDTNGKSDVFLYDAASGKVDRISVTSTGAQANNGSWDPDLSADGRYVTFLTHATNLVHTSRNGSRLPDVAVRDLVRGVTGQASLTPAGVGGSGDHQRPEISADGRYVAFESSSRDMAGDDVAGHGLFVRDLLTGVTTREAWTSAGTPALGILEFSMSPNGRYLAFHTEHDGVVPSDTNGRPDVYLRDRQTGLVELVSVSSTGTPGDGESRTPKVGDSGRCVFFDTAATTLYPGDPNGGTWDVLVRDRAAGTTGPVAIGDPGGFTSAQAVTPDGGTFVYWSQAAGLVPGDTNAVADVFAVDPGCR